MNDRFVSRVGGRDAVERANEAEKMPKTSDWSEASKANESDAERRGQAEKARLVWIMIPQKYFEAQAG